MTEPQKRESGPGGGRSSIDHLTGGSEPMVLRDAIAELADAMGWYGAGVQHGIEMGRRQLEDEWRGTHEVSAAVARFVAENGSYADLCERRGERERAERQRRIVRERGIA